MELISIQKYAALHHLSIHTVIKKTMNGELKTVVQEEEGKEVPYIVLNPSSPLDETPQSGEIDYKKAYEDLHKEYLILKTKYDKVLGSSAPDKIK